MKPGNRIKNTIDRIVEWILVILMVLMLFQVIWQVFTRYVLADPSSITDELSRFLLIWIGILGASYVMGLKAHLSLTILHNYLSQYALRKTEILINVIILIFSITVLIAGGSRLVYVTLTLGQTSASLQIPLGYIYLVIPFSGLLTSYYVIYDIFNSQTPKHQDAKP